MSLRMFLHWGCYLKSSIQHGLLWTQCYTVNGISEFHLFCIVCGTNYGVSWLPSERHEALRCETELFLIRGAGSDRIIIYMEQASYGGTSPTQLRNFLISGIPVIAFMRICEFYILNADMKAICQYVRGSSIHLNGFVRDAKGHGCVSKCLREEKLAVFSQEEDWWLSNIARATVGETRASTVCVTRFIQVARLYPSLASSR